MSIKTSRRRFSRFICAIIVLAALSISFGYGIGVGVYHWPPFFLLKKIQNTLMDDQAERTPDDYHGEKELLRFAFTDPLIQDTQILPPITSLNGIYEANRSLLLPSEIFFDAYDHLEVTDAVRLVLAQGVTVLKVTYNLAGNQYHAYAYAMDTQKSNHSAALVIPGSGLNQSSKIYKNDSSNYHTGIIEAIGTSFEKFVLIKPNEDCLAIHDSKAKINQSFFINWLLARGASYSAHYIANSLAITKYLQNQYRKVVVAGISQGGAAALLNSLQSQPHATIVSSGFSILNTRVTWSDHNQIIIPELDLRLSVAAIRSRMQLLTTSFYSLMAKMKMEPIGLRLTSI